MTHKVTSLDVVTDLRRALAASFSKKGFSDANCKLFLRKAEVNIKKVTTDKGKRSIVFKRLKKANDAKQPIEKRREDILMASSLI